MGITDHCNTKAGKETGTGQTCVQLASFASSNIETRAVLLLPWGLTFEYILIRQTNS